MGFTMTVPLQMNGQQSKFRDVCKTKTVVTRNVGHLVDFLAKDPSVNARDLANMRADHPSQYRLTETIIQLDEMLLIMGFFRTANPEDKLSWRSEDGEKGLGYVAQCARWQAYMSWLEQQKSSMRINVIHRPQDRYRSFIVTSQSVCELVPFLLKAVKRILIFNFILLMMISYALIVRFVF